MNNNIIPFDKATLQSYFSPRSGEVKLGESISTLDAEDWRTWLRHTAADIIILGAPEDIGVRANHGIGGADTAWQSFLSAFLNIQYNKFFPLDRVGLLGTLNVAKLMEDCTADASIAALRAATEQVDELLAPVIEYIVSLGKIPVLIGGGHNNAYPLLKGLSMGKNAPINVINMDAHADFRALEGRRSCNGFSYARYDGYLNRYAALGLQHAYNNPAMVQAFEEQFDLLAIWWEDIYLSEKFPFETALAAGLQHVNDGYFGIELDLDCLQDTLSSAQTPMGFSRIDAVNYSYTAARDAHAAYLHITEGVFVRKDGLQFAMIGKLISYLVQAFVKAKM